MFVLMYLAWIDLIHKSQNFAPIHFHSCFFKHNDSLWINLL